MLLRWLLPIVAVFTMLGNAVTAFAAAGTFDKSTCCCPDPKKCKCHDHEHPKPDAEMRRCGGDADRAAPVLQAIALPTLHEDVVVTSELVLEHVIITASDRYASPPEKPPF